MKLLDIFQKKHEKKNAPEIRSGDIVRIHERITEGKKERIQIFEGIVIAVKGGKNLDATFCVRKISLGVGVEKTYPLHSPKIIKIETIKKIRSKKSKLYYLRDLTPKQIQKKSELAKYVSWEDESAKEDEEELKKAKEEDAKKKQETEKKEQAELDKKFAQSRSDADSNSEKSANKKEENKNVSENSKESKDSEKLNNKQDDSKDKKSGK